MEHTVFLIDDDPNVVKSLQRLLRAQTDYNVIALSNTDELEDNISQHHPDLIIVDVMMPGVDGFEIVRRVKMNPDTSHIKVIALSGNYPEDGKLILESMGVIKCLDKPFETDEFLTDIKDIISGYVK